MFKVDQVLTQDKMQYGVVVNHTAIDKCFRKLLHQDRFIIYNFIKRELHRTLKVSHDAYILHYILGVSHDAIISYNVLDVSHDAARHIP